MQASFEINIDDYMSAIEIEDMIRDEVQRQICDKVERSFRYVSISDIINDTASKITLQLLEEQDVDLHQKIADKTRESLDELSLYYILRNDDNGKKSHGQQVLDECVEEARPRIQQKIDEIVENKLNADWLVDEVCDAFYNKLCEQLTKRS